MATSWILHHQIGRNKNSQPSVDKFLRRFLMWSTPMINKMSNFDPPPYKHNTGYDQNQEFKTLSNFFMILEKANWFKKLWNEKENSTILFMLIGNRTEGLTSSFSEGGVFGGTLQKHVSVSSVHFWVLLWWMISRILCQLKCFSRWIWQILVWHWSLRYLEFLGKPSYCVPFLVFLQVRQSPPMAMDLKTFKISKNI